MFKFVEISSPEITDVSNDDCDILYEKIARSRRFAEPRKSAVQNQDYTSEIDGSEYPSYVAEELALYHELRSGSTQGPGYVEMPDRIAEETLNHRIEILGDGKSVNSENPENDTMDCVIVCDKSSKSPDSGIEKNAETYLREAALQNDSLEDRMKEFSSASNSLALALKSAKDQRPKNRQHDHTSFYGCEICPASLSSLYNLKIHLMNHVKDTKGEANIRTKSVTSYKKSGSQVSTGKSKRRQICKICSKRLKGRDKLFYHMNIAHADLRPYQCQLCEKNYTRSTHLLRHTKNHHNNW